MRNSLKSEKRNATSQVAWSLSCKGQMISTIRLGFRWVEETGTQGIVLCVCSEHSILALSYCFSTWNSRSKHSEVMSQASRVLLARNDWLRKCSGSGRLLQRGAENDEIHTYIKHHMHGNLIFLTYMCFWPILEISWETQHMGEGINLGQQQSLCRNI